MIKKVFKAVGIVSFLLPTFVFAQDMEIISGTNIPDLGYSNSLWADFDQDDQLDLLLAGDDGIGGYEVLMLLNNGDDTFSNLSQPFDLKNVNFTTADFDADGDMDLVMAGLNASNEPTSQLYSNDGNGNMSLHTSFEGLSNAHFSVFDYNHDGLLDLLITGLNQAGEVMVQLQLQQATGWQLGSNTFSAVYGGALLASDFNQDGFDDVLIAGIKNDGTYESNFYFYNPATTTYEATNISAFNSVWIQTAAFSDLNQDGWLDITYMAVLANGNAKMGVLQYNGTSFTEKTSTGLPNLKNGALSVADVNADGKQDVALFGLNNSSTRIHAIYYGQADFTFNNSAIVLPGMINGQLNLLDFDKDGMLDLFATGLSIEKVGNQSASLLYRNAVGASNTAPATPVSSQVSTVSDSAFISWQAAVDDHTLIENLAFTFQLRNESGSTLKYAPSNLTNGFLKVADLQQLLSIDSILLTGLAEDRYYYQIQAVDQSKVGSAFTAEESFVICRNISLGADQSICLDEIINLEVTGTNNRIDWFLANGDVLAENTTTLSYKIEESVGIVARATNVALGCEKFDTLQVTAIALPEINLAREIAYCTGDNISLETAIAAHEISWTALNNSFATQVGDEISFTASTADTIIVHAVSQLTACEKTDTVFLTVYELPMTIGIQDTAVCYGNPLSLHASADSLNWYSASSGILASNTNSITFDVLAADSIFIEKFNTNRCRQIDTVLVHVNPLPVISLGADRQICQGEITTLSVGEEWSQISWYSKASGPLSANFNELNYIVQQTDTIMVVVIDQLGCVNSDTVRLEALPLPDFTPMADTAACIGEELFFDMGAGFQAVNWYSKVSGVLAAGPRSIFYEVSDNDSIFVSLFNSRGCISYDTFLIEAIALPQAALGNNRAVCEFENVSFQLSGLTDEVNWYFEEALLASNVDAIGFEGTNSGYVWVEITNSAGCIAYDSTYLEVYNLPAPTLGADFSICKADSFSISLAQSYDLINWYSMREGLLATNVTSIERQAQLTDTIWVTVRDSLGCSNSDTIVVTVNPLPQFALPENIKVCRGDSILISADSYSELAQWSLGQEVLATTDTLRITPDQTAYYVLQQTNAFGCITTDSVLVEVIELPIAEAGAGGIICLGDSLQLGQAVQAGLNYQWMPVAKLANATIAQPYAQVEADTWFYLTVTNSNGCVTTDSVFVQVDPVLAVDNGGDRVICIGESVALGGLPTATGSNFEVQYQWSPAASLDDANSANPIASPITTTTYTLLVQAGACKVDTSQLTIRVNPLPIIDIIQDTTVGAGASIELFATGGKFYTWSPRTALNDPNIARPIANPLQTTTYKVEVTDSLGCQATAEVTIFVANQLMIPNLFTPNGDRSNDFFKVYGAGIANLNFSIYSREGKQLYQTNSPTEAIEVGWDGTANGAPQPSGTYVWTLTGQFFDGSEISWKGKNSGILTLMR